jgi:predicted transcriptional regulator
MLAALKVAQDHVGVVRLQTGFDVRPIQTAVADAIAQAEAAGIKAEG